AEALPFRVHGLSQRSGGCTDGIAPNPVLSDDGRIIGVWQRTGPTRQAWIVISCQSQSATHKRNTPSASDGCRSIAALIHEEEVNAMILNKRGSITQNEPRFT